MLKLLIADDEPIERRYLKMLFQKYPDRFQVIGEAGNGEELLEIAGKEKPDILIIDINMPLLNGLDCAGKIKEQSPDTIILLNTAYAEFEFAKKALDYHLDAYLLKPADEQEIMKTIETCITKRGDISEQRVPSGKTQSLVEMNIQKQEIDAICKYIDENFDKQLSLDELAGMVHFSPPYFSRMFHQATGLTVKAYLTEQRIRNAKYLLQYTKLPIREIAVNCGFKNASNFNRVFRQKVNVAPLEYRHQHH